MPVAREDHRAGLRGVGRVVAAVAGVSGDFLLFVFWAVHLARAPPPLPSLSAGGARREGMKLIVNPSLSCYMRIVIRSLTGHVHAVYWKGGTKSCARLDVATVPSVFVACRTKT